MKIHSPGILCLQDARPVAAFTLVELLISLALFSMVITGVVYAHITGLKMFQLTQAKLGASDEARMALGTLITEVRSAQRVAIGTGNAGSFTELGDGVSQQGGAMQIYRSDYDAASNSNAYIRYYRDASTAQVYRKAGTLAAEVAVENITNAAPFSAASRSGVVLTNNDNNQVISVVFQFYQIQYPVVSIGTNMYYDFFQLSAKIARRSI